MSTARIKDGDIVLVDIKGRRFLAYYRGSVFKVNGVKNGTRHKLDPIHKNITWLECDARDIVEHYRKV